MGRRQDYVFEVHANVAVAANNEDEAREILLRELPARAPFAIDIISVSFNDSETTRRNRS